MIGQRIQHTVGLPKTPCPPGGGAQYMPPPSFTKDRLTLCVVPHLGVCHCLPRNGNLGTEPLSDVPEATQHIMGAVG